MAEPVSKSGPPLPSQAYTQGSIGDESFHGRGQRSVVSGGNQIARNAIDHHLSGTINVETHDRLARQEPVNQGSGKPFPQAGVDDNIGCSDQAGDFLRRDQSHESKMSFETGGMNLPLDLVPQHAIANEKKSHLRLRANQALAARSDIRGL